MCYIRTFLFYLPLYTCVVAGVDYVAVNQVVRFAPGVLEQTVRVTIIDDLGQPKIEGSETFELVLRTPTGGSLGQPSKSLITINDSFSDCKCYGMMFNIVDILYVTFENHCCYNSTGPQTNLNDSCTERMCHFPSLSTS